MSLPGIYTLAAETITTALSARTYTEFTNLTGMTAATIEAAFTYGSGGATTIVWVQTSFDGGTVWRDVVRFDFATASAVKTKGLARGTQALAAYAALSAEGANDGLLGDRLRVAITTTGTYAGGTLLAVRAHVS